MGKKSDSKRKREEISEEEEEEEEEEGFQVEVITAARVKDANQEDPWEYHVKWGGYGSDADSWEPAENLAACQRLLASFWDEVGVDNDDYPEGTILRATPKWIKMERRRWKKEYNQGKDEARKQKERADRKKEEKFAREKAAKKRKQSLEKEKSSASVASRSASTSSVPRTAHTSVPIYSAPAPPPSASGSTSAPPPKKKQKMFLDSDSDDDMPLANLPKERKSSLKSGADKGKKVQRAESLGKGKKNASASTSSKLKNVEPTNKGKQSAPPSRAPSPPTKAKDLNKGQKPAPPSRAPTPKHLVSDTKEKDPASLFSPSPSPPTSPEISLSSLKPKPKLPASNLSKPPQSKGRPNISVDTEMPAASPTLSSGPSKANPLPLPKPQTSSAPSLPLPRRTVSSNTGSASSSTFPSRPFGKTSTPTIPSATPAFASKPSTPTIPSAKPATPAIPAAKPATPTIPFASKSSSTPTIPAFALPAHIQRKASGSSRVVPPPPPPPSSGSGLSTKQRLAQGALALAPTNTKDKETTRKSLAGLNFKKSSSMGSAAASASGNSTRVRNAPPPKPPSRPTIDPLFDDPDDESFSMIDSPVDNLQNEADDQPMLPPALSRRRSQPSLSGQAEDFLKGMMPPKSSAPPTPAAPPTATADKDLPNPPRPLGYKPKMFPPKIPKKWKWTGKLLMDVTDKKDVASKTDHVCDVVLNELFPPTVNGGLHINNVMASAESIHLLSFHDLVDMHEFLKTSGVRMDSSAPLQQLARLGPSTEKDAEPLKILARYMTKKAFVSLVPAFDNGALVGHLLLFPPVMAILGRMLKAPDEMLKSSSLIAALLPWKPHPEESRRPFGLLPQPPKPPIPSGADWKKNMTKSQYQLGLRVLKFPSTLHEWFCRSPRPYCIWPPSEKQKGTQDRETGYLMSILKECGAKKVGFKNDLRAIFVHVGALKTIRKMPLLVERRLETCGIHFYTYGTHETVHPEYWGVREIYPFGGVVTFTPSALYEDPWGVINRMKVINKHPLWTCYILPSVLGMATKLCSPDEDPLASFDRGVYVFDRLLQAIDDGEVSILQAPPLDRDATRTTDLTSNWMRDHWINRPLGPRHVLEYCLNAFSAKYSNIPQAEWASAIEAAISEDLDSMQMQPNIMKHYRRYVVVRAESDSHIEADKDGFEWLKSSNFSFNDDFLSNPQKAARTS